MDANNLIKRRRTAKGHGLVTNSTSVSNSFFIPSGIEYHSSFAAHEFTSSTRFNNYQRFSLEQLKLNKRKLHEFKRFGNDWNGYNGQTFDDKLLALVENIISELDYQPQIFPTGRGTIQIEKFVDDNNFIEIEISENEIFAYQIKNGIEIEKEITQGEINTLIAELYA